MSTDPDKEPMSALLMCVFVCVLTIDILMKKEYKEL